MDYSNFSSTTDRSNMFYWQSDRPFNGKETAEIFLIRHKRFNKQVMSEAITFGMQQYGKSYKDAQIVRIDDPIASGSVNLVSKALLADGSKVVIRAHPSQIANGYFWVESLATQKALEVGVPVYKTYYIYNREGKFDFDFMLIEQLKGKNIHKELWPLLPDHDKKITEETGRYAAMINSISTTKFGFFDNTIARKENKLVGIHNQLSDHIYAALEDNLSYLANRKYLTTEQCQKIEKIFSTHEKEMKNNDPRLIHNDIADWNELADTKGLTGIIDWDECFSGDPVMEFAQYYLFFSEPRRSWFKTGYQQLSSLPEGFDEKIHLFTLRYVICKLHLRAVKLEYKTDPSMQQKLEFGMKVLNEELSWYRKTNCK